MKRKPEGYDAHHILHHRQEWRLRPDGLRLRENPVLIPVIPREVHNAIHANVPSVPLLGFHALRRVAREFEPVPGDTLTSMENLMDAMEVARRDPRAHPIEKDLAELAIEAVDLQRPYIREGLEDYGTLAA